MQITLTSLIVLICSLPLAIWADGGEGQPPSTATAFPLIVEGPQPEERELRQILTILNGVNQMLPPLEVPRGVSVYIRRTQHRFAFRPDTLHIGYEYQFKDRYAGFEKVRYAIAHEWGHAVWDANMRKLSPDWQSFSDARRTKSQLADSLHYLHRKKNAILRDDDAPSLLPSPELQRLNMKIDALQANRHEAESAFRSSYLYTSSRLYNEFFADLVAVLYFEDLHAMTRSLEFTDLTTGRLRSMDPQGIRSFQAHGRHHRWQPPAHISKRNVYRAFAPVRAHMGRHYLNAYNLRHHKSDILTAALRASVKEFEFLDKQVDVLQLSPEELAERFIQALDRELMPWRVF